MTTMNNEDPADPSVHEPRQAPMPCPFCGHVGLAGAEYDDLLYDAERYRFLRRKFADPARAVRAHRVCAV